MAALVLSSMLAISTPVVLTMTEQAQTYRVDANASKSIDLSLCSDNVDVTVRGDGDTDLDFTIRDNYGNTVHRDFDETDLTFASLRPRRTGGCITYVLSVQNRGDIFNNFSVTLKDSGGISGGTVADRRIAIHNHTAENFRSVYYSNTADDNYGSNRMAANQILRAGSNRTFDINDGTGACRFDIKVETSTGRTYEKKNINVCTESSVEFGTEYSH